MLMATFILHYSLFTCFVLFSMVANFCFCFNPKPLNVKSGSGWSTTRATSFGGLDGGACGYQNDVEKAPFSSLITAAAPSLYSSGKGCGKCYQVKCTIRGICSGKPVRVVVTDECPGCDHLFDLSAVAFGAMATPGHADQLRNIGNVEIQYRSVRCNFPGVTVAFRVDPGSNPYYFATTIEYENGDGIEGVEMKGAAGGTWLEMDPSWGALWKKNLPNNYAPPFSFRLRGGAGNIRRKTIVADNVIPANYSPGKTYRSLVNF